jgi:invasion protein IalB
MIRPFHGVEMAFAPKSNRVFRAAFTGLMLAGGLGLATQADAQQAGKVKSSHGAWSVVCDTPAGAPGEQCALMQNVIADDRPEVGLSVVVLKTADQQARILRVLAPLGVLLPPASASMLMARISAGPISSAAFPMAATPRSFSMKPS